MIAHWFKWRIAEVNGVFYAEYKFLWWWQRIDSPMESLEMAREVIRRLTNKSETIIHDEVTK